MNANTLKNIPLFAHCSPESFRVLSNISKIRTYKKQDLVVTQNNSAQHFLYVLDGWIKLCKESQEGEMIIVNMLNEGHYSGENFLFNQNLYETYNAQAISSTTILKKMRALSMKRKIKKIHPCDRNE